MSDQLLAVKEYAAHVRVSTRTVWRWIKEKKINVIHTPGGKRIDPVAQCHTGSHDSAETWSYSI